MQAQKTYLICYDIANPRRLQRVHRALSRVALAVQYSVFVAPFTEGELGRVWDRLACEINPKEDDIRAYPIEPETLVTRGVSLFPEGILLAPDPLRRRISRSRWGIRGAGLPR